jgi:lipopolysaccharide biosynthesis glycosyltransferase
MDRESSRRRDSSTSGVSRARPVVVFAIDEGYAMPLAVSITSILESSEGGGFDFRILNDGVSKDVRKRVETCLRGTQSTITWISADFSSFDRYHTMRHVSRMTFARLLLDKMKTDSDRLLYLDADILVLHDLYQLWLEPLNGAPAAAALDGMDTALQLGAPELDGLPRVSSYFNAGVLLMDLQAWQRHSVSEIAIEYLAANPASPYADQDALNFALNGLWVKLNPRWNCQAHLGYYELTSIPKSARPWILHFVTSGKPWNFWVPNANAAVYDDFRARTAFARTRRQRAHDAMLRAGCYLKEASKRTRRGMMAYDVIKQIAAWATRPHFN